jgi:hypothetical protein
LDFSKHQKFHPDSTESEILQIQTPNSGNAYSLGVFWDTELLTMIKRKIVSRCTIKVEKYGFDDRNFIEP